MTTATAGATGGRDGTRTTRGFRVGTRRAPGRGMKKTLVLLSCLLLCACGGSPVPPGADAAPTDGGGSSSADAAPTGGQDAAGGEDAMPGASAPVIQSLGTSVSQLTAGETVRFTAVVTDARGAGHLSGGQLLDSSGAVQYGVFLAASPGHYQLDLSWSQINQVAPITFTTQESRTFRADFYDVDGGSTSQSITLLLECNGLAACDGACVDLSTDMDNCGACGNRLPDPSMQCIGGAPTCPPKATVCAGTNTCADLSEDADNCGACGHACPADAPGCMLGVCFRETIYPSDPVSCDEACAGQGMTCAGAGTAIYGGVTTVDLDCQTVPAASLDDGETFSGEYCYCK